MSDLQCLHTSILRNCLHTGDQIPCHGQRVQILTIFFFINFQLILNGVAICAPALALQAGKLSALLPLLIHIFYLKWS